MASDKVARVLCVPGELPGNRRDETTAGITRTYKEFFCGWGASLVNVVVTFPVNKAMFRQQLEGVSIRKAFRQLKREGLITLYRGMGPPLIQRTTSVAVMFGTYAKYHNYLESNFPTVPRFFTSPCAAFAAGTTELLLIPFERVQTLLQAKQFHGTYDNTFHVFRNLRHHGISEYYRGISACFIRNGLSNTLFFGLRGPLRDTLPAVDRKGGHCFVGDFVSGAVLGALLSTLFYPLNVVKTRMQVKVGGSHLAIWPTFLVIYKERGYSWRKIFRGVHVNYSRSVLSWGIINAIYEALMRWL
ncbi:mitochondrial nicotinamide adenine dinucleotide transporter SLC25A51-like [Dysidea avara]|uniref:mitochondrial nicotinamide adenine dinucleotide transporter SLC25A51-like n=1 Tax=Dysidea avara TaxID=196820 RepID=UPI0033239FEB